jgi:hypothetical protein
MEEKITEIARRILGISNLEPHRSDGLYYHQVVEWKLREALAAAFQSGECQSVPNLDNLPLEDLQAYRRSIEGKRGDIWEGIKRYADLKIKAMQLRLAGDNKFVDYERTLDTLYITLERYLDW